MKIPTCIRPLGKQEKEAERMLACATIFIIGISLGVVIRLLIGGVVP